MSARNISVSEAGMGGGMPPTTVVPLPKSPEVEVVSLEDAARSQAPWVVVSQGWSPAAADVDALVQPLREGSLDVVLAERPKVPLRDRALLPLVKLATGLSLKDPFSGLFATRPSLLREFPLRSRGPEAWVELWVKVSAQLYRIGERTVAQGLPKVRDAAEVQTLARALGRYATTQNDTDNEHEGYNTLARMESGAPNYNAWLAQKFGAHAGRRVLEIGAGIGTITAHLAQFAEKVVALEVDDFYVRRLKNRFRGVANVEPWLADVALADWQRLEGQGIDTIVLSNVLEHIPDDAGAVRRFAQLLPSGGRLLVLVPALPALFGALDEAVGHHRRYTDATLRAVLEGNGFEVRSLEWMNVVGIPGWFVNGRVFKRRVMPPVQLRIYDQLAPWLARAESNVKLPIGMSLFCVAERR